MKGKDAYDAILAFHPTEVINKRMPGFVLDTLADYNPKNTSPISENYKLLNQRLIDLGLFKPKPVFWFMQIAKFVLLITAAITIALNAGNNAWLHLLSAFTLAMFWHQVSFLGHDGEHFYHYKKFIVRRTQCHLP